jgi:hypothetical protein
MTFCLDYFSWKLHRIWYTHKFLAFFYTSKTLTYTNLKCFSSKSLEAISHQKCVDFVFKKFAIVTTPLWPSVGVKPNTWKSWGFGVLRDSWMFRARQQGPKNLAFGVFLVSLERSWNIDIENGLALVIWTFATQVIGKRRAGKQKNSRADSLTPDH